MYLKPLLGGFKVEQQGADSPVIGEPARRLERVLDSGRATALRWRSSGPLPGSLHGLTKLRAATLVTAPPASDALWKAGHGVHMEQAVARRRAPRARASNRDRFRPPSASLACADAPQSQSVVTVVIPLAHRIGMTVASEGVETAEQHRALTDLGSEPPAASNLDTLAHPLAAATYRWLPATLRPSFETS
jgi:hypothetical protein